MKVRVLFSVVLFAIPLTASASAESVLPEDYELMELKGVAPPWWTEDVMRAAEEAASRQELYNPLTGEFVPAMPAQAPVGVPVAPDYLFIRPGALFLSASGVLCTYNFIYGTFTQIGTAGHCVEGRGETVFILAAPTVPLVTALGKVGSSRDGGVGNDWALINIDPAWNLFVDANVAYVGGPSCSAWTPSLETGKYVGHGIQTGLVASVARTGAILEFDGRSFFGAGEISGGDSGAPMLEVAGSLPECLGGGAVGVMTHCATITGIECLPLFWGTDIRRVPATVTPGFDPV